MLNRAVAFLLGMALAQIVTSSRAADSAPPHPRSTTASFDPQFNVGAWIWGATTADKQTCRFWRTVEIPTGAVTISAHLRITADNSYRLFLDGKELGRGTEWRSLTDYDLTWVLPPGIHVIGVEAFNDYLQAGMTAGLRAEFADGRVLEVPTDENWKVVREDESDWLTRKTPRVNWPPARVIAPYMSGIWKVPPIRIVRELPTRPVEERFWQTGWFQASLVAVCALVALLCVYLLSRLALHRTAREVLQRERARIARDIHDDFGARLTKLVLFGELGQREQTTDPSSRARFDQICGECRSILSAVDEVIWTVNSQCDTLRDFETHVCNYAESFLRSTPIRFRIEAEPDLPDVAFDLPVRRNLFLATKEAVNNVVRHSRATELHLGIHLRGDRVVVTVADDGCGFDPSVAGRNRHGLSNMLHRTTEIDGTCQITSRAGQGCHIEFTAPLCLRRPSLGNGWRWRRAPSAGFTP